MSIFLTIPVELIPASGLATAFTVFAFVSIIVVVVVVGFLLGPVSNLQHFALGGRHVRLNHTFHLLPRLEGFIYFRKRYFITA